MDEATTEARLEMLEDKITALTSIAQHTFQQVFGPGAERRMARETLCGLVEELHSEPSLHARPRNFERLQRMLALVEEVTAG